MLRPGGAVTRSHGEFIMPGAAMLRIAVIATEDVPIHDYFVDAVACTLLNLKLNCALVGGPLRS